MRNGMIKVNYGQFFQRNAGEGFALAGVIHADGLGLSEGDEYVVCNQGGIMLVDEYEIKKLSDTKDQYGYDIEYPESMVGDLMKKPIWSQFSDRDFFSIRSIPLGGNSYLVYSAKRTSFFDSDCKSDDFILYDGSSLTKINGLMPTKGECINSLIREPIWALTYESYKKGELFSIEPTSTPLLETQNLVHKLFLEIVNSETTKEEAYKLLGRKDYMLNSILGNKLYSDYLVELSTLRPIGVSRFISKEECLEKKRMSSELLQAQLEKEYKSNECSM